MNQDKILAHKPGVVKSGKMVVGVNDETMFLVVGGGKDGLEGVKEGPDGTEGDISIPTMSLLEIVDTDGM